MNIATRGEWDRCHVHTSRQSGSLNNAGHRLGWTCVPFPLLGMPTPAGDAVAQVSEFSAGVGMAPIKLSIQIRFLVQRSNVLKRLVDRAHLHAGTPSSAVQFTQQQQILIVF